MSQSSREMGVEEVLLVVSQAPRRQDRPAPADDPGFASGGERDVSQQHAGVDGHVVDTLLALLDDGVPVGVPGEVLGLAVDLLQRLIDRHRAHRHRAVSDDPLPGGVNVAPGGQVHHRVGAPAGRPSHLLDLVIDGRRHRRVADVGVDLDQEAPPDHHRLRLWMVAVQRDHRPTRRNLVAHHFDREALPQRDELHLRGDLTSTGVGKLGHGAAHPRRGEGDDPNP